MGGKWTGSQSEEVLEHEEGVKTGLTGTWVRRLEAQAGTGWVRKS